MRSLSALVLFGILVLQAQLSSQARQPVTTLYDANPNHIWNRLHEALFAREDATGARLGEDSLDPLLWGDSTHLLSGPSHERAMRVLDEFLQTHAENLIHDPVKHAILQHDLWAVFDWSVARVPGRQRQGISEQQKRELQSRLAEVMRRLALSPKQIQSLPDNYAQAIASGEFARDYNPDHRDLAFLPQHLFEQHGPWVSIENLGSSEVVAPQHVAGVSGRSRFLVFLRLPQGRNATFEYLRKLWDYPEPWTMRADAPLQTEASADLPAFPAGTAVALVRQMTMFDNHGNLAGAPITESIQIRVYHSVVPDREVEPLQSETVARNSQDFYEFRLSREKLFAGKGGGLKALSNSEREYPTLFSQGDDMVASSARWPLKQMPPIMDRCSACHRGAGVRSLNTHAALLKPSFLQRDADWTYPPRWWENDGTTEWKQQRYDWGLLNGYWTATTASH